MIVFQTIDSIERLQADHNIADKHMAETIQAYQEAKAKRDDAAVKLADAKAKFKADLEAEVEAIVARRIQEAGEELGKAVLKARKTHEETSQEDGAEHVDYDRCLALVAYDGRTLGQCSRRPGHDSHYCWQHQRNRDETYADTDFYATLDPDDFGDWLEEEMIQDMTSMDDVNQVRYAWAETQEHNAEQAAYENAVGKDD